MTSRLSERQYDILMHPGGIHKGRVRSRDGMAYVEAHDIKAMMIRVYGFGGFSWVIQESTLLFEREVKTNANKDAWKVGYRVVGTLSIFGEHGEHLADYSGAHTGQSTHPDIGEAHGNALTNADSYAFKRAALYPLATQGGLGLYNKGALAEIVRWTACEPDRRVDEGATAAEGQTALDPHSLPEVEDESLAVEPEVEVRQTNQPVAEPEESELRVAQAELIREKALEANTSREITALMIEAGKKSLNNILVESATGPMRVVLKQFLDNQLKLLAAGSRVTA